MRPLLLDIHVYHLAVRQLIMMIFQLHGEVKYLLQVIGKDANCTSHVGPKLRTGKSVTATERIATWLLLSASSVLVLPTCTLPTYRVSSNLLQKT